MNDHLKRNGVLGLACVVLLSSGIAFSPTNASANECSTPLRTAANHAACDSAGLQQTSTPTTPARLCAPVYPGFGLYADEQRGEHLVLPHSSPNCRALAGPANEGASNQRATPTPA